MTESVSTSKNAAELLNAAKKVAQYFKDEVSDLRLNAAQKPCLGKTRIKKEQLYSKLFNACGKSMQKKIWAELGPLHLECMENEEFAEYLELGIVVLLQVVEEEEVEEPEDEVVIDPSAIHFNDSVKSPLSENKVILNLKKMRNSVLYDATNDAVHQWDYEHIDKHLSFLLTKAGKNKWLSQNLEQCVFEYLPLKTERIYHGINGEKRFNTWTDAEWVKGWEPDPTAVCPPEIKKYMDCLLPNGDDKRLMYAWARDARFGRANPILVLCGAAGIGKNNFVLLVKALVGANNYREASRGFKNSAFHSNVTNCRLFLLDETDLTPQARDTLKAYHNGTAAIERKGVDVGDPEPLHASFVIANNFEEHIKLEFTDRKFFAPKLTDTPLLEQMPQEEVDHLFKVLLQDPEYIKQFASYLYHNYKPNQSEGFKRSEFFRKLCVNSYPPFFKRFIKACQEHQEFTYRLFGSTTKYKIEPLDIQKHLDHYEKTFKKPLATFINPLDGKWSAISKIYNPNNQDKTTTSSPTAKSGEVSISTGVVQ